MSVNTKTTSRQTASPRRNAAGRTALAGSGLAAFLALVHAGTDAFTSMVGALLPTLQARFGLTETGLALLVATLALSSSVTQPLLGAVADRLGLRAVSALGIVLSAAMAGLAAVVPSTAWLAALLFVGGLGSAAFHPAGMGLARTVGGRNKELAIGLFGAGGTLGVALGPVLVLGLLASFGLGSAAWLLGPGIALGLATYRLVPVAVDSPSRERARILDLRLLFGPIGLLALAQLLASVAFVTFTSAMPLWLVRTHGVARDAPLLGWTLATFSLAAAAGGIASGALSARVSPRLLVPGAMLLALPPLYAVFHLAPGTPVYFLAAGLAGASIHAGLPILIVSAQDRAPHAVAAASGMLMGFATGVAGLLYIGVGRLQEAVGLAPAMRLSYLALVPGALLAFALLRPRAVAPDVAWRGACRCAPCPAGSACLCPAA